MISRALVISASVWVWGCGSNSSPGSVIGTIHGQTFVVSDAISASVTVVTMQGVTVHEAAVVLGSKPSLCSDAATATEHPSEQLVIIGMTDVNGLTFTTPTAPGTYAIYQGTGTAPPKSASLSAEVLDSTCKQITADAGKATTGTVTLTAFSGDAFDGNYDVVLDSGDHVTGSFTPEACPALQTAINSTTQPCI